MNDCAVQVTNLTKRFGGFTAVDGVTFNIQRGEIFGFLGPNGAGKTTTVRMLTGYIAPTSGTALLDGYDVVASPIAARRHLGVAPEEANVYVDLSVWHNVMLMAELHGLPRAGRTKRGRELLEMFGLADRMKEKGRRLSKGLRQRLMLCMALVSEPEILFLDEPTSGLDVASARLIREIILRMNREKGTTVFLTTHNIGESDMLCHRVAVINNGRIAAIDTPRALRSAFESRHSVEVTFVESPGEFSTVMDSFSEAEVVKTGRGFRVYGNRPGLMAQEIATRATEKGLHIESLSTQAPSLEDVFLHIIGNTGARKEEGVQ